MSYTLIFLLGYFFGIGIEKLSNSPSRKRYGDSKEE